MGNNQRIGPSGRYPHLSGAIQCPTTPTPHADAEVASVLRHLQGGPTASDGVIGLTRERFVQCVRLLRDRGAIIATRKRRSSSTGHNLAAMYVLTRGPSQDEPTAFRV